MRKKTVLQTPNHEPKQDLSYHIQSSSRFNYPAPGGAHCDAPGLTLLPTRTTRNLTTLRYPQRKPARIGEHPQQIRHAIKLPHTQIVLLLRNKRRPRIKPYQHILATGYQMLHLVTKKLIAISTTLHPSLPGTGPGLTHLIRNPAIAETPIALDVLGRIILMAKKPPPTIHHPLPDLRILRTRRAQVAIVTAITDHLFHNQPSLSITPHASRITHHASRITHNGFTNTNRSKDIRVFVKPFPLYLPLFNQFSKPSPLEFSSSSTQPTPR